MFSQNQSVIVTATNCTLSRFQECLPCTFSVTIVSTYFSKYDVFALRLAPHGEYYKTCFTAKLGTLVPCLS
jgi:hypothetical protein